MSFAPLEEQTRKILFITIGLQIIKQECKAKLFLTIIMIFFFFFLCVCAPARGGVGQKNFNRQMC